MFGFNHDGVAKLVIRTQSGAATCTGTLLPGGKHILTAGHCVNNATIQSITVQFELSSGTTSITAASWHPHPLFNQQNDQGHDVGIIVLNSVAPAEIPRTAPLRMLGAEIDVPNYLFGYGLKGHGATGRDTSDGRKRGARNMYEATGLTGRINNAVLGGSDSHRFLFSDFDSGLAANDGFGVHFGKADLGFGADEGYATSGDSGGPIFVFHNGEFVIAGTVSRGTRHTANPNSDVDGAVNGTWGQFSIDTRVAAPENLQFIEGFLPPAPPVGVNASDGSLSDSIQVAWTGAANVSSYEVWRHTTADSSLATQIATGVTTTQFTDVTAVAGTGYTFWVKSVATNGTSEFSAPDSGWRGLTAPANLTATQDSATQIDLSWVTVAGTIQTYEIWRTDSAEFSSATKLAEPAGLNHSDTTAPIGVLQYYWVRARNGSFLGALSGPVQGMRISPVIDVPTGILASDGLLLNGVSVFWNSVTHATGYEVWRHQFNDSAAAVRLGANVVGTSFTDEGAVPGVTYYYWIKAVVGGATSNFSSPDSGWRGLAAPVGLISDNSSAGGVLLSWSAHTNTAEYAVFRGLGPQPTQASELARISATAYLDGTATAGQTYYWFVRAIVGTNHGNFSAPVSSQRIFAAPGNPTASLNSHTAVTVAWSSPPGLVGSYEVWRATITNRSQATLIHETANSTWVDTNAPIGLTLHYWIRAKSASVTGEWSGPVMGRRPVEPLATFTARHGLLGDDALPESDPDGDGFSNFAEWAYGQAKPQDGNSRPSFVTRFESGGVPGLLVCYLRLTGGNETANAYQQNAATYSAAAAHTLGVWSAAVNGGVPPADLPPAPAGYEWGCFRLTSTNSEMGFVRISIQPPL